MINAFLTKDNQNAEQIPIFIRQIRYGQYGLAQIIAEIPRYELYVRQLLQQENVFYIHIFDGLTRERARVDVIQVQEDFIRLQALGDIATLRDNPLYSRFWYSTSLQDWAPFTEADADPPRSSANTTLLNEDALIITQQRGLNITMENGNPIPANHRNGYLFRNYTSDITGFAFEFEGSMDAPMEARLQYRTASFAFIQDFVLYAPPPSPGLGGDGYYHLTPPANTRYVSFYIINNSPSSYNPPFAIGFQFSRIRNIQITSSIDNRINTTLSVAITSTGQQFATPVSMENIIVGLRLQIDVSDETSSLPSGESVTVISVTSSTFEAVFNLTHPVGGAIQGFFITPDEILKDVVGLNSNLTTEAILLDQRMIADENILAGSSGLDIINRVITQYSNDRIFFLKQGVAHFADKDFYANTYKGIVEGITLSSRLSTVRNKAKTTYQVDPGVYFETDEITTTLFDKYEIDLPLVIDVDTSEESFAIAGAQSALDQKQEVLITLTFRLVALMLDGSISLPLYWLRPYDIVILGNNEFEGIQVRVLGWAWNEGGESINVEANVQEADIIKLLAGI